MRKVFGVGSAVVALALVVASPAAAASQKFDDEYSATADCGGTPIDYTTTTWGTYTPNDSSGRYTASAHTTTVWTNGATGKVTTEVQNLSSNGSSTVDDNGQVYLALFAGSTRFIDENGRTIAMTAGRTRSTLVLDANGNYVSSELDERGRTEREDICQIVV